MKKIQVTIDKEETLVPIHKLNNGNQTTLCHNCSVIITEEFTDRVLCYKCLYDLVYEYKTYNEHGFVQEEIEGIIKLFPKFNRKKYDDAMMGNTCMMTIYKGKSRIVNYHCDVLNGLNCGVENRNLTFEEWD